RTNNSGPDPLGITKEYSFTVNGMQPGNIDRNCQGTAFVPEHATQKTSVDLVCPEDPQIQIRVTTGADGLLDVEIGYA
ncbi:MAG: hypothetical protein LQ346_009125, partial [Caloplaca aetnensis]